MVSGSFEVHREPLFRRYYAKTISGACVYSVVFGFLLIFLPLIIAYNSSTFWIKENIVWEQPSMKYKYQAIVQLTGKNALGDPMTLYYSTSPTLNMLNDQILRIPVLQSAELDDNRDGLMDRLELSIQMPLASSEEIWGIGALFFHDVQVSKKARYLFDAAAYVNYQSASGMTSLKVDGDLTLRQTWALNSKGGLKLPYLNSPLLSISPSMSAVDASLSKLLSVSAARNLSLAFNPTYQYAEKIAYTLTDKTPQTFNATFVLRVHEQAVRYTPAVSEVLKYAWIQYISFFAIISFLLFRINSFVFRHQLLYTHVVADVVYEKLD